MSISACLIAKNEERWIGDCLDHLRDFVKEIIVVDTGSNDRTVEIAREKGARVSKVKWENDFSKARNASLDKATQRWILIIDPDERLARSDLEKMTELAKDMSVMAYAFQTRNYSENPQASGFKPCSGEYSDFEQSYPGYFESKKIRLFQNVPSTRFVGSVHELVESTIKGKTVDSDIPFHHFGSTKEVKAEKNKTEFYRKQTQQKVKEEPQNWKAHFEQGVECLGNADYRLAMRSLEKAREMNNEEPLVLSNLGYACMEAGKLDEAEKYLNECLKLDPKHPDAWLNLGVTTMRRQKWEEAIQIFDKLAKMHPGSFMAFRNAGNCYARLEKFKEAAICFEHALKIFPDFNDAKIDLGIVCFAGRRIDIAEKILNEALQKDPHSLRAQAVLDDIKKLKAALAAKKQSS